MIRLLSVPYFLGRRGAGMGAGPESFLAAGAVDVLQAQGHAVEVVGVDPAAPFEHEIGASFAVLETLAEQVRQARAVGAFPFVLAGNCGSVAGVLGGLSGGGRRGVVWFDAHADANTPEITESGFLDGMAVAVLTGRCWQRLSARIPGFAPLPDAHILLAGVRSVDEQEEVLLSASQIGRAGPAVLDRGRFEPLVAALGRRVEAVHVHVDLDVIDPSDGRANEFAADGGPRLEAIEAAIAAIAGHRPVSSVSLASYNPAADTDGRALRSGLRLLDALGRLVSPPRS